MKSSWRKKKTCTTYPTSPWKKKNRKRRSSLLGLFLEFIKGGAQIPTFMAHTPTAQLHGRGIALTILMEQAPFHLNITNLLYYPSASPSFLCSALPFKTHPSFLPLGALHQNYSLMKLFHSNVPQEEGRRKKRRGEHAVWLSRRSKQKQLRTESSGMPR